MLAANLDKRLICALHNTLAADVNPRSGCHLAIHHQSLAVEFAEVLPGRPVRHQIGIGDEHARRVSMGSKNADRLARLHEQGFVLSQVFQRLDDAVETFPIACRLTNAAVNNEFVWLLSHVRIKIIHQHTQSSFLLPAFTRKSSTTRRPNYTRSRRALTFRISHCLSASFPSKEP